MRMEIYIMPRKPTGKITSSRAKVPQKNGDIYIYEREYQYDPVTKKTKRISNRLAAKIPKGTDKEVPTRPKRSPKSGSSTCSIYPNTDLNASRKHTGLMDILEHAGKASGIDQALYSSTDRASADKIISIARFLVATSGDTLPHIETWQLTHPIPYPDGITEDVYYCLCKKIGTDETFRQKLFYERCRQLGDHPLIAFDSTTSSTYSENQVDARYGFNKEKDGMKTIKYLTLYSIECHQPIAFAKQPGNLPDVTSLSNTLEQLEVLGVHGAEIVTDNGYYSEGNLASMCLASFRFITLVKTSSAWVRRELDAHMEGIMGIENRQADLGGVYGCTVMLKHSFQRLRKYASRNKGLGKGDLETFEKRLYLHFYYNPIKKENDDAAFYGIVDGLKKQLEEGVPASSMAGTAQKKIAQYLSIRRKKGGSGISVSYNIQACREACRYHGYFALVSNHEKDRFAALRKYRRREKIEEYFQMAKEDAGASRPRVWYADHLMGRMLIQFAALSYEDYLRFQISRMKETLGKGTDSAVHSTKETQRMELKLKKWLEDTSFSNVLRWFDAYETTEVSTTVANRRWNSEITIRDRMFLEKLGM